jgi:transcriptional regulator GlxA family with amidase domain
MRVSVLILDGVFDMGLAAILDTLETADGLGGAGHSASRFEVRRVGVRRRIRTHQGLEARLELPSGRPPEVVVLPALGMKTPETLTPALGRRDVADACALLREWAQAGALVGAACTGTFVLAQSGLLDGRAATTTWWLAPLFRQLFPSVSLEDSRMVVESARVVTAGAALAHIDLALWLVRRRSPSLASMAARYLVVDSRPNQASFAIPDHLAHADPLVERFETWARRHLQARFSLQAAARSVGASERTLARRLRSVLGKSPLGYVQELRVEHAVHLLQTSSAGIDEIAGAVGYRDGVTLRSLLRRKLGRGVRELRRIP